MHRDVSPRIIADALEIAPALEAMLAEWRKNGRANGAGLAKVLDQLAVAEDNPVLRTVSDGIRLASLRVPLTDETRADAIRVALALQACLTDHRRLDWPGEIAPTLLAECELLTIGWTVVAIGGHQGRSHSPINSVALQLGREFTAGIQRSVEAELDETFVRMRAHGTRTAETSASVATEQEEPTEAPEGHVIVCSMPAPYLNNTKTKELVRGHEHAINKPIPLRTVSDLNRVRARLVFEAPYAEAAVDRLIAPLISRATLPPTLLCGPPGAGKSRIVRRLSELLEIGLWRTDAAQADGTTFGGTERRWHSAEPCHAFMAISRYKIANPIMLIDELDKAATRSDYGRIWDSLLAFLEAETAKRYPDPALQNAVDVSHVSYVATANATHAMPSPLLDRLRLIHFPEPRASDLDRLIPPVLADLASERSLDARWVAPLTPSERALVAQRWQGGSVRRLRQFIDVILRARDREAMWH
jgi:hypothetical protein